MTEETTATPSISTLDVLPPHYREALEVLKKAGLSFTGSINFSIQGEDGQPLTVFSYEDLQISNTGISASNVEISFAGIKRYSGLMDEIIFAFMPPELRENLASRKAHKADCQHA